VAGQPTFGAGGAARDGGGGTLGGEGGMALAERRVSTAVQGLVLMAAAGEVLAGASAAWR